MFKSFVVSQKSQKQNLSEQHHLIARAMNGLTSDRYKKVSFYLYCSYTYYRVATHSGNFQVEKNLRETQGISGNFD